MALNWVDIDLSALRHNFHRVKQHMSPGTSILGVVKSDAYGHGMVRVARELAACGAEFLAVSKCWEAFDLREAGVGLPVLVLLGVEPGDMEQAVRLGIRPVLFRMEHARELDRIASSLGVPAPIHIKVDTGMGRLGVPCDALAPFLDELSRLPGIRVEGVISHMASADEADKSFANLQVARFTECLGQFARKGIEVPYAHISNSAGVLDFPQAHFQLVRPGIMLYGSPPSDELMHPTELLPVMSFSARVLQVKDVPAGRPIGYGGTYVTSRDSRIATLPVGYDDGYFRSLSNKGSVLIRGKRAPVVGRVSMNMITVDVTGIPDAEADDEAVLLGSQGDERITGEEIARLCGTISYEVFCAIGRNRFKFFHNASEALAAGCSD